MSPGFPPFAEFEIREAGLEDVATLFVTHAAVTSTGAGQLLEWTRLLEERLEAGGRAWLLLRRRQPAGYALIDPLPGLPGIVDLTGGIVPAGQRRGLGSKLLSEVITTIRQPGIRQLSCRVENLDEGPALFLMKHGFTVEHEECLLQLNDLSRLPPIPDHPSGNLTTYPRSKAVAEFCKLYERSFAGMPWSQPYTEAEVESILSEAEDLRFMENSAETIGVIWLEALGDGQARIEPLGVAQNYQGSGYGRRLLVAALHEFRRRKIGMVEIGLWRENVAAMHLYQSLGFIEVGNWYYLAYDLAPVA
jgi:ribosomal protein S18 acetylase RimI-like enzyme